MTNRKHQNFLAAGPQGRVANVERRSPAQIDQRRISTRPGGPTAKKIIAFALLALLPATLHAADNEGISVVGSATIKAKPTEVTIQASVTGEAELAADASVKYTDAKKKAVGALRALNNPDLSIDWQGSSVDQPIDPAAQQRIMNGQGGTDNVKQKMRVTEQVHMTLKNLDKLPPEKVMDTVLKIIDTARDGGLQVGPPPPKNWNELQNMQSGGLMTYKIPDITSLQDQAYKQAMDDAHQRAQRLADLSGAKLGKVLSAHDQGASSAAAEVRMAMYGNDPGNAPVSKEASSSTYGDLSVTVKLSMQYQLDPK